MTDPGSRPCAARRRGKARSGAWVLAAVAAVAAGCGGGGEEEAPRDVLLITVDTLRADFLGCYGSPFGLTPALDALAADGALFERHYTTAVLTGPAHLTLLSGLSPEEHGVVRNGQRIPEDVARLGEAFGAAGYRTAAVIASAVLGSQFGYDRGFEVFDEDLARGASARAPEIQHQRTAEEVVARALEILAEPDERPLFLWVHLYDVHGPFVWPAPPALERATLSELLPELPPLEDGAAATPAQALELARGYGAAVAYADRALADLLAGFERERGPRGVVAMTSDHGEGLWEHAYDGHGLLLYEEAVRVPFLLRARGLVPAGVRVRGVTSGVDVPRTLLALAHAGPRARAVELAGGESLAARLAEPGSEAGEAFHHRRDLGRAGQRENAADEVQETFERLDTDAGEKVGLARGGWKAIGDPHGELALYDLAADPAETVDLAEQRPDVLAEMRARMLERALSLRRRDGVLVDDAETRRMLDALGY